MVLPNVTFVLYRTRRLLGHCLNLSHTTFNISFFPLLFFFSGLYYTDVASTLLVLTAYRAFLRRQRFAVFIFGAASLWFRQTNVFWVVILLGGLEIVRSFPRSSLDDANKSTIFGLATGRQQYAFGHIYNPRVQVAEVEDYLICCVSIVAAVCAEPYKVLASLRPYLVNLTLFVSFVIWNRGVVLGK